MTPDVFCLCTAEVRSDHSVYRVWDPRSNSTSTKPIQLYTKEASGSVLEATASQWLRGSLQHRCGAQVTLESTRSQSPHTAAGAGQADIGYV